MTSTAEFADVLKTNLPLYLHARDGEEVAYLSVIAEAIENAGDDTWPFFGTTCEVLAELSGATLRLFRPVRAPGAFFGVDPAVHSTPEVLQANRMIAAAANQDHELLTDIIVATGNSITDHQPEKILGVLAHIARMLHRETCPGMMAHRLLGPEPRL